MTDGEFYDDNKPEEERERTREEIEDLKVQWLADGCWDLEETEGFQAHRAELKAFAVWARRGWFLERKRREALERQVDLERQAKEAEQEVVAFLDLLSAHARTRP